MPSPTHRDPRTSLTDFLPSREKLFARTPPALFPALLGMLGLGLALRRAVALVDLSQDPVNLALGGMVALWVFAVIAMTGKILRRPSVVTEDLRGLPGRLGFAAATMSGMTVATIVVPYAPAIAFWLVIFFLALHGIVAVLIALTLVRLPKDQKAPSAAWHLAFVGFIVGAVPLAQLGWIGLAKGMMFCLIPVAAVLWGSGLAQVIRGGPAVPLRPILAIHLAPFALFALVATLTDEQSWALVFTVGGLILFAALILSSGWLTRGGFGPLWAAFTFPLSAFASALLAQQTPWPVVGLAVTGLALLIVPVIVWKVIRLWPGGKLAARTNAALA